VKRIGGLFERIASAPVLAEALWRAARGKADRRAVRALRRDAPAALASIAEELRAGTYRFGPYTSFEIRDPKSRTIRAPAFRDRVVHHAMLAVTGPVFERGAIGRSYACRKGRGQHRALDQAARWTRHHEAFLKLDVRRFYDSISHECLLRALGRRFREARLLDLFAALLDSYRTSPGHGLPIGALTSQYLGNFTLDPLDHWVLERAGHRCYLRYMDDMLLFGELATLRGLKDGIEEQLLRLGLRVKDHGILNRCVLGVPWLGFTLYPDRIRSSRRGRQRLRRRLGELDRRAPEDRQARATALFAHARWADDLAWRRTLLEGRSYGESGEEGEVLELRQACHPRRLLEQPRQEVPLRLPQQEAPRQPQRQPGLPLALAPRHGGVEAQRGRVEPRAEPPDDAPSRAPRGGPSGLRDGDESRGRPSAEIEIPGRERPREKTSAEAPPHLGSEG
jgi:hypothetical protein